LALWQAHHVKKLLLKEYAKISVTIKVIKTTGDKNHKVPLAEIGGKALFLKEIEESLLAEKIDIGVHSMKDVPSVLPQGLTIASILKREDPRDVFLSKKYTSLLQLPKKAKIGTSSPRRQAQIKNFRPDFEVVPLRGNIETRLRKLSTGGFDAIVLSAAGLLRLGFGKKITEYLSTTLMLPSGGQGAIGLEVREGDEESRKLVEFMTDLETSACVQAERAFLKAVEADCQAPVAAYAEVNGQNLKLTALVASKDGRELLRDRLEGNVRDAVLIGTQLAKNLFGLGAREILRSAREKNSTQSN